MLFEDADISVVLTITPGQTVTLGGDRSLVQAPFWGSGGFTVQGSLSLTYVGFSNPSAVLTVADGGSLKLASMAVPEAMLAAAMFALSGAGSTLELSAVTVPGQGELSGMVAVQADGSKAMDPASLADLLPGYFITTSGPCTVSEGGRCVGRAGGYGTNEDCTIVVGGGGGVLGACGVFDMEGGSDYVTLPPGTHYDGGNCPTSSRLNAGDQVGWHSNGDWQGSSSAYGHNNN